MTSETQPTARGDCPAEWVLSVYVDRETAPDDTRAIEAHLIGCRACRETVVMLEDEVRTLRAALHVEETESARLAEPDAARSLAIGSTAALAGAFACFVVVGWLGQLAIPPLLAWLNPSNHRESSSCSSMPSSPSDTMHPLRSSSSSLPRRSSALRSC